MGNFKLSAGLSAAGHVPHVLAVRERNGARLSGVRLLAERRGALSWPETETNLDVETVLAAPPRVVAQVSVAEDKRFELLRGCPQHAFQACALGH